jgi:TATA-binding protein-associated factor Taf7
LKDEDEDEDEEEDDEDEDENEDDDDEETETEDSEAVVEILEAIEATLLRSVELVEMLFPIEFAACDGLTP